MRPAVRVSKHWRLTDLRRTLPLCHLGGGELDQIHFCSDLSARAPRDRLTGSDPTVTDYVLEVLARRLQCGGQLTEKTLVEWDGE